jgi:hypothetical protein
MKKQIILVGLVLISCGPSQSEIEIEKLNKEITKTFDLIDSKLTEAEYIQNDIDFNNRMYSIGYEDQYLVESERLVKESDDILMVVDSLNNVVDLLSKKIK